MRFRWDTPVTGMLMALELTLLLVAERRWPLRDEREPRATRLVRNGVIGGLALAATGLIESPIVMRVAEAAERRAWGLLPRLRLPAPLRTVTALLLLDYGMYRWHEAMHRVPALWRLHLVHHVDRDLDVTTALRIHVLEIVLSVGVRVAQVAVLGITPRDFTLWQRLFACSVLFQHANFKLPANVRRIVGCAIVTPHSHGIHHLARPDAQHGNWSGGLAMWDWLHGTVSSGDPAGRIGVPAFPDERDVGLGKMLALPFRPPADVWLQR